MQPHNNPASMHTIHMWGSLRQQFGESFRLHVSSVREATTALGHMIKGFRATVAQGRFRIIVGDRAGRLLSEDDVGLRLPPGVDVHIVPVVQGAGSNGVGKIIVGVILAAATWYAGGAGGWASLGLTAAQAATATEVGVAVGLSMALSGAAMLLSPQAKTSTAQQQDAQNSFNFSGVQNTTQQGVPVPIVYGLFEIGSVVVSAGISTQQLMN